jgi:hypothetical protein
VIVAVHRHEHHCTVVLITHLTIVNVGVFRPVAGHETLLAASDNICGTIYNNFPVLL